MTFRDERTELNILDNIPQLPSHPAPLSTTMADLEGEPSIPNLPEDLTAFRIQALPPSFYYIPNFLTPIEETLILQKAP